MKFLFLVLFAVSPVFAGNGTRHLPPSERYLPVMKQIVKFSEFLQSELLAVQKFKENRGINKGDTTVQYSQDLELEETVVRWGEELTSGETSGNIILKRLLNNRLKTILNTEPEYRDSNKVNENVLTYLNIRKLTHTEHEEYLERARSWLFTRFQFINLLIKRLFDILDIEELDTETIDLLRSSVSLWPLLKGETRSLGNAVFDAGMFAIVDAYLEDQRLDSTLEACFTIDKASERDIPQQGRKIFKSVTVAFTRLSQEQTSPTWNKKKYNVDAEIYKAHLDSHYRFIPFVGLGIHVLSPSQKAKQGVMGLATDYDIGKWKEPLPDAEFLHPHTEAQLAFSPSLLGATFFETFPFEKLEEEPLHESKAIEPETPVSDLAPAPVLAPTPVEISEPIKRLDPATKAPIIPAGVRKFHALMPSSDYAEQNLNSSKQKIVDDFFDPRKLNTMTYGKFRALWLHLGGRIEEDHGSSHKLLIGPRGEALFGVYAHGDSQTYSPKTIKYLRTALWHIGCRPQD